jgi:hypothetical protein
MFIGAGIGSFVQGDTKGGWTGLLGELGSFTLMMAGYYSNMFAYMPLYGHGITRNHTMKH